MRSTAFYAGYRYQVGDRQLTAEHGISREQYVTWGAGQKIAVVYLPDAPEVSRIGRPADQAISASTWFSIIIVSLLGLLTSLPFPIYAFQVLRDLRRARSGEALQAASSHVEIVEG